jgi:hypothetical protein
MASFNVASFVSGWDSAAAPPVNVSKPKQINCWTKASKDQGGGIHFGDTTGKHTKRSNMHLTTCAAGPDDQSAKAEQPAAALFAQMQSFA